VALAAQALQVAAAGTVGFGGRFVGRRGVGAHILFDVLPRVDLALARPLVNDVTADFAGGDAAFAHCGCARPLGDDALAGRVRLVVQAAAQPRQFLAQRLGQPGLLGCGQSVAGGGQRVQFGEHGIQRGAQVGIGWRGLGQADCGVGLVLPRLDLIGEQVAAHRAGHRAQRGERSPIAAARGLGHRPQRGRGDGGVDRIGAEPRHARPPAGQPLAQAFFPVFEGEGHGSGLLVFRPSRFPKPRRSCLEGLAGLEAHRPKYGLAQAHGIAVAGMIGPSAHAGGHLVEQAVL